MTLASDQVDRVCRFPQCERPALASLPGVGRPPEYCQDPGHNRAAAWRARQRTKAEPATGPAAGESARPVDAARARASEIRGQVTGLLEQLGVQLPALVQELRTLGDPDAAEAQIEAVTSEAQERVAAAAATRSWASLVTASIWASAASGSPRVRNSCTNAGSCTPSCSSRPVTCPRISLARARAASTGRALSPAAGPVAGSAFVR